jgi:hypothetical protein
MGMFDGFFQGVGNIANAAVGNAGSVAKDIGAGLGWAQNPQASEANQQALDVAQKAESAAASTNDPAEKARLHQVAANTYAQVSQNAGQQSQSFSPDVQQNPGQRAVQAGAGIATAGDLGGALTHPVQILKGVGDLAKGAANAVKTAANFTTEDAAKLWSGVKGFNPSQAATDFIKNDFQNSFKLPSAQPAADASAAAGQATNQPAGPQFTNGNPAVKAAAPNPGEPGATPAQPAAPQAPTEPTQPTTPTATNSPYKSNPMYVQQKADPQTLSTYQSIFQVPRQVVKNFGMDTDDVVNHLIQDGVTNVRSMDDVKKVTDQVTGATGAFPTINKYILQDVEKNAGPLDFSAAKTTAANEFGSTMDGVKGGILNTVKRDVEKAFPQYEQPGELPSTMPENHANATDLLDASQRLGNLQAMETRKAYNANGELTNTDHELAASALKEIKNKVDSLLNDATKGNYQAYKQDPRVIAQLQRLPGGVEGPLAQRWLQNAKTFKDGQAVQKAYVIASRMADYTKDTDISTFTKWTNELRSAKKSDQIAQAVTHPVKTAQAVMQKGISKALSPLDPSAEDLMAEKTSGQSAASRFQKSGPAFSTPAGAAPGKMFAQQSLPSPVQGGAEAVNKVFNPQVNQNNSKVTTDNNNEPHNSSGNIAQFDSKVNTIGDIPQQTSDLHQNPDGTYGIANLYALKDQNGAQLIMSPEAIKQQQLQIDAAKNTPAYKYSPSEQMRVGKMQDQLTTVKSFSEQVAPEYEKALTKNNTYSRAIQDVQQAGPSILNYNGKYDDFIKQISGKYADLATQLKLIEAAGGINPNVDIKGSTLLGALQTAQQGGLLSFYNNLSSTVGYTGSQETPPAAVPSSQAPQSTQQSAQGGLMGPQFSSGIAAIQ